MSFKCLNRIEFGWMIWALYYVISKHKSCLFPKFVSKSNIFESKRKLQNFVFLMPNHIIECHKIFLIEIMDHIFFKNYCSFIFLWKILAVDIVKKKIIFIVVKRPWRHKKCKRKEKCQDTGNLTHIHYLKCQGQPQSI